MTFTETVLKLLHEYKKLIKKQLVGNDVKAKINSLGLKRSILKRDNEIILFKKATAVINDWNTWAFRNKDTTPLTYSGMEEFFDYFSRTIAYYQLENNKVIHVQQKASSSLVKAIQLISMPTSKMNLDSHKELQDCIYIINKYGSKEQQKLLLQSLRSYREQQKIVNIPTIEKITSEYATKMAWREEEILV